MKEVEVLLSLNHEKLYPSYDLSKKLLSPSTKIFLEKVFEPMEDEFGSQRDV
jgi:hypothetical protein